MNQADSYSDFVRAAEAFINNKQIRKASELLQDSIENMPEGWKPYNEFSTHDVIFFWYQEEFDEFNRRNSKKGIIWKEPSYSKALYLFSHILSEQNDFHGALREIDKGLVLEPDHPKLLCEKAFILGRLEDHTTSLLFYQKAVNARSWIISSDKALALRGQGFALIELGRLNEARTVLNESLLFAPDNTDALGELAYIRKLQLKSALVGIFRKG